MKPFEEQHTRFFFGRQELIKQLYARIAAPDHLLTVVLGISGSGKSSLVKAGLIPYLRNDKTHQWQILPPMRPGESPFASLARILLAIALRATKSFADTPVSPQLNQIDFLTERLQGKHKQLNAEINQTASQGKENSSRAKQLQRESETLTQIIADWHDASPLVRQRSLVEHFEVLYALCQTEEQESEQQRQLKQTFLDCLAPLNQQLQADPGSLVAIAHTWAEKHPDTRLLLVIDQFEELITLGRTAQQDAQREQPEEWQQFLSLLETTLAANLPQLRIIVTLRSDFEPRFLSSEALKPYWSKARFPVRAMRSDELRQAIEGPASEMALYFEPANLVDRLTDEVGQMPGALPLLSFTLSELYVKLAEKWRNQEPSDRALVIDARFDQEGGVAGSLTRKANEEYQTIGDDPDLGEAGQLTMRRVMLRMLTLEGSETARRRVPDSELIYPSPEESDRVKQVVDHLVKVRLLVKGQLETGETYVEPAHDFLVRGWDRLQEWIKQSQGDLVLQQRLTPTANDWSTGKGGLWTREVARLTQLEKVLKSDNNWLNQLETKFVNCSIQQRLDELQEVERQRNEAIEGQIGALASLSETRLLTNDELGSLIAGVKAGVQLKKAPWLQDKLGVQTTTALGQAVYRVQERNRLQGHTNGVFDVSFSPDSELIATASADGTLKLWRRDGTLLKTLQEENSWVRCLSFSPNGKMIASASGLEGTVKIWSLPDSKLIKTLTSNTGYNPVNQVSFSPDSKTIAAASYDNSVKLWNVGEGRLLQTFAHSASSNGNGGVLTVSFHCNGQVIAFTNDGSSDIEVRRVDSGELLKNIDGGKYEIRALSFSPDGQVLAFASLGNTVKLWKVEDDTLLKTFEAGDNTVYCLSFSHDGQKIAVAGRTGTVKVWSVQNETLLKTFEGHNSAIYRISFSHDDTTLASASADGSVKLWSLVSANTSFQMKGTSLSFSADGRNLAFVDDKTIKVWSTTDNQLLKTLTGHSEAVSSVSFSSDDKLIASGSNDKTIKLWNAAEGQLLKTLTGHSESVSSVSFSSDGKLIASGSNDKTIKLWRVADGQLLKTLAGHSEGISSMSFSPTDETLISYAPGWDGTVKLWSSDGSLLKTLIEGSDGVSKRPSYSPDGRMIACNTASGVKLWSNDGTFLKTFDKDENPSSISISLDGKMLAYAIRNSLKLWSLDGEENLLATLYIQDGNWNDPLLDITDSGLPFIGVNFSPDGKTITAVRSNNSIALWTTGGKFIKIITGENTGISYAKFSLDGKKIVAIGDSIFSDTGDESSTTTLTLWDFNLHKLLVQGCDWLHDYLNTNPNLSEEDRYLCSSIQASHSLDVDDGRSAHYIH